jgi:hypothetical protein
LTSRLAATRSTPLRFLVAELVDEDVGPRVDVLLCRVLSARSTQSYGARCVMTMDVPVIVNVAVRSGPVLAATANWTVPSPEPDAP